MINPYRLFIHCKNWLYDHNYLKHIKYDTVKVISVGNLNTGGSGKTPFIIFLVDFILKHRPQAKICVVTKSYKAQLNNSQKVDLSSAQSIQIFGDEACLLQSRLLAVDVWSGPSKSISVQTALATNTKYDYVIVDDGFSHRKLKRDLEITLIDTSRAPDHYRLLPVGRMREDWSSLKRSDLILLTKTHQMPAQNKIFFLNKVQGFNKPILFSSNKISLDIEPCPVILITGLGNPEAVKSDLFEKGYTVMKEFTYPDHYSFPELEQIKILNWVCEHADWMPVVTEKDYIKINNPDLKKRLHVIQLDVLMNDSDLKYLYEKVL